MPTGLQATPGNAQVSLQWNAVMGATGYNLFRSTVAGQQGSQIKSGWSAANYMDTGLANGTKYYYRVAAMNANGASNPSPQVMAEPVAPPVPGAPSLSAAAGNTQVTLTWGAVNGATSYNVYRSTASGGQGALPVKAGITGTNYIDLGLNNGTTYFYKLTAANANGEGARSNEASAKPFSPELPAAPSISATPGNAQVGLSWAAVGGATSYNLYRATSSGGQSSTPTRTGLTGTSYTDPGLTNGTTYFYKLAAVNANGEGAKSNEANAKPVAPELPAAPSLSATPGNAEVTLNWGAVAAATSYNLYRSTSSGGQGNSAYKTGLTGTTYKDTGLTNGTTYYYKLAAVNANGTGEKSNEANAKPAAPPVPTAPTGFTATAGDTKVTLNWTVVGGATSYNLYRSTTSGGQGETPVMTGILTPPFVDTGLVNNTTYYYKVAAVNANGVGAKSSQASAKPVPPPIPGAPSGFTAVPGNGVITLNWSSTTNATSYNLYRGTKSGQTGDTPFMSGITALTFLDTALTNGTTYYYKLAAVGVSGIGTKTAQISATPSAPAVVLSAEQRAAHRFLRQATWGPTPTLVNRVVQIGKGAFIDEQFALPATPYPQALVDMPNMELVSEQFFQNAMQGQDQLRQRVAWALSQIWVASAIKVDNTHAMVPYIRILEENAFGNVRDILEKVTLSPAMGEFLDMVNNKKAANGAMPNENYARELMQLFTIGLTGLNPDGTPSGQPTYSQTDILEMSRVLTGWTYGDAITGDPVKINNRFYEGPMEPVEKYHDTDVKSVMGTTFLAGQNARADLKQALDLLFNHPNMGPFLVKQLIQRLVKSDPSPAYIASVVGVFNNNGQGVRGDLKAVVKAILMHPEAAATPNTGKFSEPALFILTLARGLNSTVVDHPYMTDFSQDMSQRIWFAPSVFNYFSPGYRLNGTLGPELQIWSTATAMTRTNFVASLVSGGFGTNFTIDTTPYIAVAGNSDALVDTANALLMGGTMGTDMRQSILTALGSATSTTDRIRTVLYLVGSSMQYQVEH
jgi:uncharacterized protein (DUF1800 family)/fibronectin type 3 domain-containing protein